MARLIDTLRQAVQRVNIPLRQLAREVGCDVALLSRFKNGKAGIGLELASDLAELLGLELVPKRQGKTKGGRSRGVDQH